MSESRHRLFQAARLECGWSLEELWLSYLGYGGTLVVFDLDAYLHGLIEMPAGQQEVLACVLNEQLADLGRPSRVPYLSNLPNATTLGNPRRSLPD
ncbi:hypothetical protein GCM10009616_37670 [Microlunatus lacustris]